MNITVDRKVLEMALEALEEAENVLTWDGFQRAADALRTALEQPEQEPVAWMHNLIDDNIITHRPADIDRHPDRWTALYPEPKPLTDDEIQAIWKKTFESGSSPNAFARAIEAAHSRQDDYELLGYVELGGYFGVEQARKNGLSGVPVAIYVEPLLPEPNNDLTQMVPIYIKPAKEKPTT